MPTARNVDPSSRRDEPSHDPKSEARIRPLGMTPPLQPDLFGQPERKLSRFEIAPGVYVADPEAVRKKLLAALAELRAAEALPWDARRAQYWRVVFPQMTNWLPAEEAAQLRSAFAAEMQRLDAA